MRKILALVIIISLVGCDKNEDPRPDPFQDPPQNTPGSILTSGPWYPSVYRDVKIDASGQVVYDTSSVITSCVKEMVINLRADSSATRELACIYTGSPSVKSGSWSLRKDSSFYVNIPYSRCSYATGCMAVNGGIDMSKMVKLESTTFTVMMTSHNWWGCGTPCNATRKEYWTFIRK